MAGVLKLRRTSPRGIAAWRKMAALFAASA
ncbi:MAG: hypothetical protein QOE39_3502, partial [Bradyrhizobium sp.]|nr:hypothetical protein [Bradyrhizobium sp.]